MSGGGIELYIIPEMTSFHATDTTRMAAQELLINELAQGKKIPKLSDVLKKLKETLKAAGITEWESTIETYLEVTSGSLPGGKAGIKTTIKLSGKTS
jgi:hypothetical protein